MSNEERRKLAEKLDQELDEFIGGLEKRSNAEGWPEDRWQEVRVHITNVTIARSYYSDVILYAYNQFFFLNISESLVKVVLKVQTSLLVFPSVST